MSAAIAANARAARISLLVAGFAGQFAIAPLVPLAEMIPAAIALLAIGWTSLRLPLLGANVAQGRTWWQWRQLVAFTLILLCAIDALTRLRGQDVASEARTLTTVLLFVQVAHALASTTRREAGLGCAVVVAMCAVAAFFAGDVTLLLPFVVAFGAIAVTSALLQRAALLESADGVAAGGAGVTVRSCLAPVAAAAGAGVLMFLAMPNSTQLNGRRDLGHTVGALHTHDNERAANGLDSSSVDLLARGPLSGGPVLSAPADAPQYWQGAIYDDFDGTSWTAARATLSGLWQGSATIAPNGRPFQYAPGLAGVSEPRTDDVTVLTAAPPGVVLAPGVATSYAGPGRVVSDLDGTPHLIDVDQGMSGYLVTSVASAPSDAELRAAHGPDSADPKWTAVPASIAPRVSNLAAQLAAGAPDRLDAVNAIENYLRTNEKYDLDSPEPQHGDDAVDDFLFVSHRGFCEQFATAAVVMLRSVGVPARLVTGYAFGDTASDPGRRIFRGTDAHAWVQVYYPGVGWVDSDPTPAGALPASSAPSMRRQIVGALERAWQRIPGGRIGALVLVCLVIAGTSAVVLAAGRWVAPVWRRRGRRFAGGGSDGPVLKAYLRLEAELDSSGQARAPGETFGEFAYRLGGLVAAPGEVAGAMRCLERECYARESRAPSASEIAVAVEVFERLRSACGSEPVVLVGASAARTAAANRSGAPGS